MNARKHRVSLNLSPLYFPEIDGLRGQSGFIQVQPPTIIDNKVVLTITCAFTLANSYTNKEYEILNAQSTYEIPTSEITTREDIYTFFNDAIITLMEAYQYAQKQLQGQLPDLSFPLKPIETYQREIDGVFHLLNSRN